MFNPNANSFAWYGLSPTDGSIKTFLILSGVFAAVYIVRGASIVVWAIKDGRDAAESIQKFLEAEKNKVEKVA